MERFELSEQCADVTKFHIDDRRALVCGFCMQVAHEKGEKGNCLTVKDNQVYRFIPLFSTSHAIDSRLSCGLDTQPDWVIVQ